LSRFGLSGLCEFITFFLVFSLGWGLKKTYSSPWELSNDVSHSIYTHRGQVGSWLLVVGSQIVSLTPNPSFCHNLCCRCSNGSCEAIFDIYTSITFQWHVERLKARCFDPYNRTLEFWESRRTPKSTSQECECHFHILPKVGLRQKNTTISKRRRFYRWELHYFFNFFLFGSDAPPYSWINSIVNPKVRTSERQGVGARSLIGNTSGVEGCVGVPRWGLR